MSARPSLRKLRSRVSRRTDWPGSVEITLQLTMREAVELARVTRKTYPQFSDACRATVEQRLLDGRPRGFLFQGLR